MIDTPNDPSKDDDKNKSLPKDNESLEEAQEDAAKQREEEGGYQ